MPKPFGIPGRLMLGIFGPRKRVLGVEFAGTVEAVGEAVTGFKLGDRVFGIDVFGCHAEYKLVRENECVALMPPDLSFEDAAGVPFGGVTALDFLNRAGIKRGQKVLINGASGCVGAYAVQLAKHFGAEVTGVCSAGNAELVRSLGASRVIDYATTDFAAEPAAYDLVMDTVGNAPFARCAPVLAPTGALLTVLGVPEDMFRRPKDGRRIVGGTSAEYDENVVKVSIVGLGMRSHAGVAAKMFALLAKEGVNIQAISTSEIKVSCLVESKYAELSVRALHDGFDLGA